MADTRHDQMGIIIMLNSILVVHAIQHALNDMDQTQINVVSATTLSNMYMQVMMHDN